MRLKIVDDIRNIIQEAKGWAELEIEYTKLTLAEKATMLLSTLIIGFICFLLGMVVLLLLGMSIAELYKMLMCPALAYLASAGSVCVLLLAVYLLRRPLLLNPIARMLTRILLDRKNPQS